MAVVVTGTLIDALEALVGAGGLLEDTTLRLFSNDYQPNINSVRDDFEEATYTGYAKFEPVVWGDPYDVPGGEARVVGVSHQFQPTGSAVANIIYGWYLTSGDDSVALVMAAERLENPESLASPADALIINAVFPLKSPNA